MFKTDNVKYAHDYPTTEQKQLTASGRDEGLTTDLMDGWVDIYS